MLIKLGRPVAALNEYYLCLNQAPSNAIYHVAAGYALAAQDKFSEALDEFARAETLKTNLALPHIGIANVLLKQGHRTNAVAELWSAVRNEPYNSQTLSIVARVMATHPDETVRDGQSAVFIASKANGFSHGLQPETLAVLGMAFAETGDYTNAVACAATALDSFGRQETKAAKSITHQLQTYRNHQPWREFFSITNLPVIY